MKYSVYLSATAGLTVEVEAPEGTDPEVIYDMACDEANLNECEPADWDGGYEILDEAGIVIETVDPS